MLAFVPRNRAMNPLHDLLQSSNPLTTAPATSVRKAAKLMGLRHQTAIAIVEDGRLLGVFTEHDALVRVLAQGRDPDTTPVSEVMTPASQPFVNERPAHRVPAQVAAGDD